eukprot:TRINITY_DN7936_c0_g1_i1.p1 TRINITY_DN7936_c0_g1~~TRINITY_DN7936_c0_g1_i1.p1  ORF type:complete len:583 (-),score=100.56 TRINITY_DN7936_c0_g1_i1:344-2023(-)
MVPPADMLGFPKRPANYLPLTPMSFLHRAMQVWPNETATTWEASGQTTTWLDTWQHSTSVATALVQRYGIKRGDVVAILARNTVQLFESHYAVPMSQGVLLTLNFRLDPGTLAYCLEKAKAKVLLVDSAFVDLAKKVVSQLQKASLLEVVDLPPPDATEHGGERCGQTHWNDLLATPPALSTYMPGDEWQPLAVSFTSGTTGRPKGVVYHHRGAYVMAMGTVAGWGLSKRCCYMCTVPMFHCNGWCFPWTGAVLGAKLVLFNNLGITSDKMWQLINLHKVTNFGGAPILLNTLVSSTNHQPLHGRCSIITSGAPPTPATLKAVADVGFDVLHVYGTTESYGHTVLCESKEEWQSLPPEEQAKMRALQGLPFPMMERMEVLDDDGNPVSRDGQTVGEICLRGNCVMSGYLEEPEETEKTLKNGWFHTGDAAVIHSNNYMQVVDRFKDIIISGGENISSVAVEAGIAQHPAILNVAVVAMPSKKYGESPCCFFEVKESAAVPTEAELKEHCKTALPRYMCPARFIHTELPKTTTGKIQKFELRQKAKHLLESVGAPPSSKL